MNRQKFSRLFATLFFLLCSVLFSSCGGGGGGGGGAKVDIDLNGGTGKTVTADAGADQNGSVQTLITLDGSNSTTDGAGTLTYKWSFLSKPLGSATVLSADTAINPILTCDKPGTYIIKLVVSSDGVDSAPDTITIKAYVPIVNAGPNQLVSTGTVVNLDGNKTSYGGPETLTYKWTMISQPEDSIASIFDASVIEPSFTPDIDGLYEISLVVNNGVLDSNAAVVKVKATTVPVANAGLDSTVSTGTLVTLDGRGSSASNGGTLSYKWIIMSRPIGSSAMLSDPVDSIPSFSVNMTGKYIISLVVNNGSEDSAVDVVEITAAPPEAKVGDDQQVSVNEIVFLDGSGSSDASGADLFFNWTIKAKPEGSIAEISDSTAKEPTLLPDVNGDYFVALEVNNGRENSDEDVVTISATSAIAKAGLSKKISTGSTVILDGSSSNDPNNYLLTYAWMMESKPADSLASLDDNTLASPSFISDKDGTYEITLIVNNGFSNSLADTVTFTSTTAPVANAGSDQSVSKNEAVTLDGSISSDSKGKELIYKWSILSKPDGSSSSLSSSLAVNPTFIADMEGDYVISLVVNNGAEGSLEDTIKVVSSVPVANGGANYNAALEEVYVLDGRGSNDVNDYPLMYDWSMFTSPFGSLAVFSDSTVETPSITFDIEGEYTISLIVTNGFADSIEDLVVIQGRSSVGTNSGIFSENFESGIAPSWTTSNGIWEVGLPTSGPNSTYIGSNVLATGIGGSYSGSSRVSSLPLQLPPIIESEDIYLGLWQWFNLFVSSGGFQPLSCYRRSDVASIEVSEEISVGVWGDWTSLATYSASSGGWGYIRINLSSYADKKIKVGFNLLGYSGTCTSYPGWYIDEVLVEKASP